MLVYGINPVLEALRAGRVTRVRVSGRPDRRLAAILSLAAERRVRVTRVDPGVLDRETLGGVHQGVVAEIAALRDHSIADLVSGLQAPALIVVLDGIEDPHNLGAILRSVDAVGAHGVVRQARRAAPLSPIAAKASAGALAHVRIATVVNIARALDELKAAGVWTVGLDAAAPRSYAALDLTQPTAVVLGAEGAGLRRLVRERCDWLAAVPMRGHVESLNVAVTAGVVLFEALRQRTCAPPAKGLG